MPKDYGWIYFSIIALFGAMIFIGWLNSAYLALNCLWVLRRWIRCAFFTLALAVLLDIFFPARNFAVLCACGTMLYFLGETMLYWMEISMFSASGLPPFPKIKPVESAWPSHKKYIALKRDIEALGFKKSGSFKGTVLEGTDILYTAFDSADETVRIFITFATHTNAASFVTMSSISTFCESGKNYYTDSTPMAFGLFHAPSTVLRRYPCVENPLKLLRLHNCRLEEAGEKPKKLPCTAAEQIITDSRETEAENIARGLFYSRSEAEELGTFTPEGKYRIWKDMILLNYLPFLAR